MTRRMQQQRSHTSPAGSCARASASHWLAKSLSSSSGSGSKLTGCIACQALVLKARGCCSVETARANDVHHLRLQGTNDELGVVALPVDDLHAQSLHHSPPPTPRTPPLHVTSRRLHSLHLHLHLHLTWLTSTSSFSTPSSSRWRLSICRNITRMRFQGRMWKGT